MQIQPHSRDGSTLIVAHYRQCQSYETVRGSCIQKKHHAKWLASDMNFKQLHIGCPIPTDYTPFL